MGLNLKRQGRGRKKEQDRSREIISGQRRMGKSEVKGGIEKQRHMVPFEPSLKAEIFFSYRSIITVGAIQRMI